MPAQIITDLVCFRGGLCTAQVDQCWLKTVPDENETFPQNSNELTKVEIYFLIPDAAKKTLTVSGKPESGENRQVTQKEVRWRKDSVQGHRITAPQVTEWKG